MVKIYSAEICPFAQRARALLTHLGEPFEVTAIDLSNRDPEFLQISPTGKIPLLLDGDLKLYESQVIIEYLAEKHGWKSAFSPRQGLRARQKLAMKQWDSTVITVWYRSVKELESFDARTRERLERELHELAQTLREMQGEVDNLLAIYCAPFWARMDWLRDYSPVPAVIDARPPLRTWLDRTVELPAIEQTLPDREWTVRQYVEDYAKPERR